MNGLTATDSLLVEAALLVLIIGLGMALIAGLLALLSPARAVALSRLLGQRHSLRQSTRALEMPIATERAFYHHHRLFGAVIVVAAVTILLYLGLRFDAELVVRALAHGNQRVAVAILVETFVLLMWIGASFSLVVGLFVFLRPSALKHIEALANEWVSTRQATRRLASEHRPMDRLFEARPRLVGAVVTVISLVTLVGLLAIRVELR
ncbi:MAG TPA: hypothetical protein ENN42_03700 [Thioalkalivibrio sp.]|nr:hypothetical protein [Thioalkalivibrio sp.]